MKKKLLLVSFLLGITQVNAQVGIGTLTPNESAELTIQSNERGILIPNVKLTNSHDDSTIKNGNIESLLVYNTSDKGDVFPGFYYWDNTSWSRLSGDGDIPQVVANKFDEILKLNNNSTESLIKEIVAKTEGNVFMGNNELYYITANGDKENIDLSAFVKDNQVKTDIKGDGGIEVVSTSLNNGSMVLYTISVKPDVFDLKGDVTGKIERNKVIALQGVGVKDVKPTVDGQALVYQGTEWAPGSPKIETTNITNPGTLSTDGTIVIGDNKSTVTELKNSVLADTQLSIKEGAITSAHILDGSVQATDMAEAGANQVLVTGADKKPIWMDKTGVISNITAGNGLNMENNEIGLGGKLTKVSEIETSSANTLAIKGLELSSNTQNIMALTNDGVLQQVKSTTPKFFHMPSITLDTKNIGATHTVNLYNEFTKQFKNIPSTHNSTQNTADIPFPFANNELDYYITHADESVIKIISVSTDGELKYEVLKNAEPDSYANIVFVVK